MKFKFFGKQFEIRAADDLPPVSSDSAWQNYLSGRGYASDADTALKVAAVFRCVDIISKTIAALPLHLFEEGKDGRNKARTHPLYNLTYIQPNRHTTAYEMWQMFVANLLLTRGAFLRIDRDARGRIIGLRNIPTRNVSDIHYNKVNGERYIYVTDGDTTETLRTGDFVFTPSFLFSDASSPHDPMRIAADVLGLNASMTEYAQRGFSGASPGGFVEYPAAMSDQAYQRFKEDFQKNYQGVENAGRWLFLENGGKATPWDRDMEKSQLLESRKWMVSEVCRIFGVPLHLCMDLEHATFSNIEQQSMEFVRDGIRPIVTRIEQTLFKDLLNDEEKKKYYYKFNLNGLLRGDTASRTAHYNAMRQNGIMNADEIRELEDMNAIPGGLGQIYTVNGNMIPLSSVPQNLPKGAKQ